MVVTTAVRLPALGLVEKVTVKVVAVAAVTVPTAPLLNTTVLLPAVVLNPNPRIVTVVAVDVIPVVLVVTEGITVATCAGLPLETELVVTTAVKLPRAVGLVPRLTVSDVAVAVVTVPTAPLLNNTILREALGSKPKPVITMLAALIAKLEVPTVTTGLTVAICTAAPLLILLTVTTAVRLPAVVGFVERVTVSEVVVAVATVPTAPLLKRTVLREAVVSKPDPAMMTVVELAARLEVLMVITGTSVATCTAVPLFTSLTVTVAVKLPALGLVENVIVRAVAVAAETVPTAPLLKTKVLLEAVVSKPKPLIVMVVAVNRRLAVLDVTTGLTVAT